MRKNDIVNFILNNDNLEILKERVNKFNPFKILKTQDQEIRHSNVIAWILDPNGNHNLDDRMLRKFLLRVMLKPENDEVLEHADIAYELQQRPLNDIKVLRESNNIDVTLISEKRRIVILIENKVYSKEHSDQLSRYYNDIVEAYESYKIIPIYLTLYGDTASHNMYFTAGYDDLLSIIEFARLSHPSWNLKKRESASSDLKTLIMRIPV